ncbi:glycoside hydrolase family 9 protein [Leptothoe sp. PORK10 BA2]|uniref:glycoside hydrolase family 9 protein n=1 Tax=Leptothoe sp. PORK10 BA2 TaxID=3110254 RepID=UPI002B216420|nr:glycoside hydrolase family 9 protein [Leptothoe sp. PORK10 BA2]MEA5463733.1 glycoside hydrolase family 9 protein [Leptothoe sp. PORK10 BA2]
MLESLLSFLLGWTNVGQCNSQPSSNHSLGLVNVASTNDSDQTRLPVPYIYTVSENVVALRIETGEVVRGKQVAYEAHPRDVVKGKEGWTFRNGKALGQVVPGDPGLILLPDQYLGSKLDTNCADDLSRYQIRTADGDKIHPSQVYRKSKIDGMAQTGPWDFEWPMVHTVFLELPAALVPGEVYRFSFADNFLQDTEFVYQPEQTRSEAVQVSHLGFDPDDVAKVAFLSTWMGHGGGLSYEAGKAFWLIDTATGEKVYAGKITLSQAADEKNKRGRNHNDTDVFMMDFSQFSTPGRYRVYVDGVGTSYEFEIGEHTWRNAFYVSARGMYHQRSGIALEQPYTDYERPRPFHPDDGVEIYRSTVPLMDTQMGFNYRDALDSFEALMATRTEEKVPEAWGGWMDAGDWDRRISHLSVSRSFLELVELYPEYFNDISLNLPESGNNLPDIVDEALWGLDVFRRLQNEAGGVSGGIESSGHPLRPEGSWQESQTIMVYGPDIWSSYMYANVAARAAYVLAAYDQTLANTYQESAIRAMNWANAELAKQPEDPDFFLYSMVHDERNLAAAELYRLTGDEQWHRIFLDTTVFTNADAPLKEWDNHNHSDAAFVYARTEHPTDQTIRQNAINTLVRTAKADIENIERTGFKWNDSGLPIGWGTMTTPHTHSLFHAHALTGDDAYLRAGLLATQFAAGANPSNMVYTIGVGHRNPKSPLMADVRALGQDPPPGITIYGPMDLQDEQGHGERWQWAVDMFAKETSPTPVEWPTSESYFDSYYYVPVTEFTVHQSIGPTAYAWGYLAASDQKEGAGAASGVGVKPDQ